MGDLPPFNWNPYNGYINPYYWVEFPIPYYMEMSWELIDPIAYKRRIWILETTTHAYEEVAPLEAWIHHSFFWMVALPETNSKFAPENRPGPKRKRNSYSKHPFSGAFAVSFREGTKHVQWHMVVSPNLHLYLVVFFSGSCH